MTYVSNEGASIGLKLYAFYPWLYEKLKKAFIGVVHNEKHDFDVPAFRFDSVWRNEDRRRVAKVLELFHPESAAKKKAPKEGMTAGSAAFLMTYSLLLEFILCDAIGVILGTVNADSGAGWDLYTIGSITINAFAFVVNLYSILRMLCKPPYSLFNPAAFVGPERVPLTAEDPRHPNFTGAKGWAMMHAKTIGGGGHFHNFVSDNRPDHDWNAHHTEFAKVNRARKLSSQQVAFERKEGQNFQGRKLSEVVIANQRRHSVKEQSKQIRKASMSKIEPDKNGAADFLANYKQKRDRVAMTAFNPAFLGAKSPKKSADFGEPSNHFYPGESTEAETHGMSIADYFGN